MFIHIPYPIFPRHTILQFNIPFSLRTYGKHIYPKFHQEKGRVKRERGLKIDAPYITKLEVHLFNKIKYKLLSCTNIDSQIHNLTRLKRMATAGVIRVHRQFRYHPQLISVQIYDFPIFRWFMFSVRTL